MTPEPTNFDGSNAKYGPPEGMDEDQVRTLFAWRGELATSAADETPVVVTCWKLTNREMKQLEKSRGKLWLTVIGRGMPPVFLSTEDPRP